MMKIDRMGVFLICVCINNKHPNHFQCCPNGAAFYNVIRLSQSAVSEVSHAQGQHSVDQLGIITKTGDRCADKMSVASLSKIVCVASMVSLSENA